MPSCRSEVSMHDNILGMQYLRAYYATEASGMIGEEDCDDRTLIVSRLNTSCRITPRGETRLRGHMGKNGVDCNLRIVYI